MVLVALLAVGLIAGASLALAADDDQAADTTSAAASSSPTSEEIPALRTATSATFELPSGERQVEIYESPINFKEDGQWRRIDTGLEDAQGAGLTNGQSTFDLHLPDAMGEGSVQVADGDQWVSYRLLGHVAEIEDVEGSTATYETASGAVAIDLTSTTTGVKEEIQIDNLSAPSTFAFELKAAQGLTPELAPDGSVRFKNQEGHSFAVLPPPTIADSSGTNRDLLGGHVSYSLAESEAGTWRLIVTADREWLADPERVWPVTLDPSVSLPTAIFADTAVTSTPAPNGTNYEGWKWGTLGNGWDPATGMKARTFLKFDLSAIPAGASVYDATFALYSPITPENTPGLEMRRLTRGFGLGISWVNSYNFYGTVIPWTTPGGDFGPALAEAKSPKAASPVNFNSSALTDLVSEWVGGQAPNNGVVIKQTEESGGAYRFIHLNSSSATPVETRPKLVVSYWPKAPSPSKVTFPTEGTRTAKRLKLKAAWPGVGGITGIKFQWREKASERFQDIPVSLITTADGKALSSWNEAGIEPKGAQESGVYFFDAAHASANLASKGGALEVRALLVPEEAGIGGYTPSVHATVDRNMGSGKDSTAPIGPGSVDLLTGNFSVTRTDVSIPGFNSTLEFSRTINSRGPNPNWKEHPSGDPSKKVLQAGVFGGNWEPTVPVEAAGGSEWQKLVDYSAAGEGPYVALTTPEGFETSFGLAGGSYAAPPELAGWQLTKVEGNFVLADLDGNRTTFAPVAGSTTEFVPVSISTTGGSGNKTQMVWDFTGSSKRLAMVIAPTPPGVATCSSANYSTTAGCKTIVFTYGVPAGVAKQVGERLLSISYYAPGFGGPWEVARYEYNSNGNLIAQWDPRISPSLKETYAYSGGTEGKYGGQLQTLTPPGLKPWTIEYGSIEGETPTGALKAVKRDSLVAGTPVAQTTIAYGVPLSGGSAPIQMGPAEVKKWAQTDVPVDATAIFPPDQVPASPPTSYSRAALYYMDGEGYTVNTATPKGAGTEAPSISTSETDSFGNVVRELTPQNRLRALAKATQPEQEATAKGLSTQRFYSLDGTEMQEEFGPEHSVRVQEGELAGQVKAARQHTTIVYDLPPAGVPLPTPAPHLPVKVVTGASIAGQANDADRRITETKYDWTLRKPTESIVDPEGLNLRSVTVYNATSGLPVETRQPSEPGGGGAGTTKTTYWREGGGGQPCSGEPRYAGLPCLIEPAAQPGTPGQPQIKVTKIAAYNALGQPTEVWEAPGKAALEAGTPRRTTITTYDTAGRTQAVQRTGGGATVPKVKFEYDPLTGARTGQRFDCATGGCEGSDDQAVMAVYDALGRAEEYKDADGNTSKTTYDLLGRPATTNDGKGTQTRTYDPTSGLLTKLEDSAAGTFTASYDADGKLVAEGLPNGLVAEATYDEAGQIAGLAYDKSGSKWLDFDAERSINGQILWQKSLTSKQEYNYDKAGRLVQTKDWDAPTGGSCTTRKYVFGESGAEELAGKNSNRTKLITREPGIGGACAESGGSTQAYEYDTADRLKNAGITYDDFGRTTSLPANLAAGKTLATSYFSTDMVAIQIQNGVTNTFQLDAALRQSRRVQGGGFEGTEVFHYAGGSDSPAWTQFGSKWTRNISGIGGAIGAVQDSGSGTLLQLTNLHGDIVATASLSPSATKPVATFEYDEFGNPKQAGTPQFGWLGGKGRRTEFPTGVIQMGARSYVPTIGRFISVDPIRGGSASAYDYVNADPINGLDLAGTKPFSSDCLPGFVGCKCKMWASFTRGGRGRLVLTTVRKCNVVAGITMGGLGSKWGKGTGDGFSRIPAPQPVQAQIEPVCRLTDPCQNYQKHVRTFHCEPGKEYEFSQTWEFQINLEGLPAHTLNVKVEQWCPR